MIQITRATLVILAVAWLTASAQTPQEIAETAETTIQSLDVQRQLPSEAQAPDSGNSTIDSVPIERLPASPPPDTTKIGATGPWRALFRMLSWMVAICGAVLLIAYASESFPELRRRLGSGAAAEPDEEVEVSGLTPIVEMLSAADEFAAAGKYSEAMHRLLVDAVAMLHYRLDSDISDSMTSRELLRVLALGATERRAFLEIVTYVERSWFGERPAGAEDYAVVRRNFAVFQRRTVAPEMA